MEPSPYDWPTGLRDARESCARCGKSIVWDRGDLAWSDADGYNLICVEGSTDDGSDALGHVLATF